MPDPTDQDAETLDRHTLMRWPATDALTRSGVAIPLLWSLLFTAVLAVAYSPQAWPLVDMHGFFATAAATDWPGTLTDAFRRGREYRPLQVLLVKLLYEVAGLQVWFYKTLVLLQFMAILAVLIWLLRPTNWPRTAAVIVALGCVAGLPSSQILIELFPGNVYSLVTLLVLVTAALALHPRTLAIDWVFLPLTLVGLLFFELAALAPLVLTMLWMTRAPGVGRRGVGASWLALAMYAGIRLSFGDSADALQYTESGLGFVDASRAELGELFASAPYLFAIYNVVASALTVLFSEPRAGKFKFVESLLHGNTPFWLWFHVISSTLTTITVGSLLVTRRRLCSRDGQLVALALTLMAGGSALGFLYTRDRIGVLVGVGYAVLLAVALTALWEHLRNRWWGRLATGTVVVVLVAMWTVRDAETGLRVRDTARETYLEWTDRYEPRGGYGQTGADVLERMRSSALARVPPDPRDDPTWTYVIFERLIAR